MADQSYEKTVLLACTAVVLFIFITMVFMNFKNNQAALSETNAQTFAQLTAELSSSTGGNVSGTWLKSFMTGNKGSASVEIWIDGTKWDGSDATLNNVQSSDSYTQDSPTVSGGKTIYKFTKS